MRFACLLIAAPLLAGTLPPGTEFSVRLTDPIRSEAVKQDPVHAVLIAPVVLDGQVALPAGAQLTAIVRNARAASDKERARIELVFNRIELGGQSSPVSAIVSGLDNARESVDEKGVISGIDASQTFSSKLDQGIAKLESNDRLSMLAGIINGAKQTLNIQAANPNIDYDPGVELTIRLTAPLVWNGPVSGEEAKLQPFPEQAALVDLVTTQPFRTVAENPPRPSDMTNLMFIGTEEEIMSAFTKAGWSSAARLSAESKLETARAIIEGRGYREGPMSVLLLGGRPPDFSLQKGNNTFAQRHHLRIFRRPGTFAGKSLWVCSATHDIGIEYSDRDHTFIHRIDSDIDRERAKVVNDLLYTGAVRSLALVDRPSIPHDATNATGDVLQTDGRMAVLLF